VNFFTLLPWAEWWSWCIKLCVCILLFPCSLRVGKSHREIALSLSLFTSLTIKRKFLTLTERSLVLLGPSRYSKNDFPMSLHSYQLFVCASVVILSSYPDSLLRVCSSPVPFIYSNLGFINKDSPVVLFLVDFGLSGLFMMRPFYVGPLSFPSSDMAAWRRESRGKHTSRQAHPPRSMWKIKRKKGNRLVGEPRSLPTKRLGGGTYRGGCYGLSLKSLIPTYVRTSNPLTVYYSQKEKTRLHWLFDIWQSAQTWTPFHHHHHPYFFVAPFRFFFVVWLHCTRTEVVILDYSYAMHLNFLPTFQEEPSFALLCQKILIRFVINAEHEEQIRLMSFSCVHAYLWVVELGFAKPH